MVGKGRYSNMEIYVGDNTECSITMDERTEKARGALMTYTKLRSGLLIENFLPALRLLLMIVEYSRVDDKGDNVAKVDELFRILLTKENQHFEGFCTVLANNGYKHWADKLRNGVNEPHQPHQPPPSSVEGISYIANYVAACVRDIIVSESP